ncbi:hypothetical protein [Aquipuribacter sp. SD81]|uniref:hypothetical protein n=1 Tax=Aquipuribacter sp. SD81 TaxID=3127703 RepID=UPI003015D783
MPAAGDPLDPPDPPDRPPEPRRVAGEVVGSRVEPRLGGAPRRLMVRLFLVSGGLWLVLGAALLAAGVPWWGVLRVATGVAALVLTVGWRVLRLLHRQRRGPVG